MEESLTDLMGGFTLICYTTHSSGATTHYIYKTVNITSRMHSVQVYRIAFYSNAP